jgi:hypothetical protein
VHKVPVGDFHCGMRALRRDVWEKLQVRTPGMAFATELIVNASQIGTAHRRNADHAEEGRPRSAAWDHARLVHNIRRIPHRMKKNTTRRLARRVSPREQTGA